MENVVMKLARSRQNLNKESEIRKIVVQTLLQRDVGTLASLLHAIRFLYYVS